MTIMASWRCMICTQPYSRFTKLTAAVESLFSASDREWRRSKAVHCSPQKYRPHSQKGNKDVEKSHTTFVGGESRRQSPAIAGSRTSYNENHEVAALRLAFTFSMFFTPSD